MQRIRIELAIEIEGFLPEAVVGSCSVENMFLQILQNSQGSTCARVSFLKKLPVEDCNFIKKETLT